MAYHLTLEERDRIRNCGIREPLRRKSHDLWSVAHPRSAASCAATRRTVSTMPHKPSGRPSGGGGSVPWSARWKSPRLTRPSVRGAQEWSPEQIAGRMRQQDSDRRVSSQTIYTWIKQDDEREHWESLLRRRGKRPNHRKNATTTGDAARIDKRPEVIEERLRLGDFEGDTVLGPAGTGGLATMVDRKSRFTIITKVKTKNADHVHERIKQRMKELDEERRHSITLDNGTEFGLPPS